MSGSRIGIVGGLSWESTASYYRYFNQLFIGVNEWSQPQLLIDSVDFGAIVPLQREGNWEATGEILADSARRLERAGATVLGIGANTMHVNFAQVQGAVAIPVIDVRDAIAKESLGRGHSTLALLGTKYLIEGGFYSDRLQELGVTSIKPTEEQSERLQFIIFSELTRGIVTKVSRAYLRDVASSCLERGASVVGLCCTEFGMLMDEEESLPVIDSTRAHVRALLAA
ncbi:MAG TPA: amino acid racemase [Acidimicrobiales bacterium]|nr:amino acid racemase [Acidimicrobiales bacterium]